MPRALLAQILAEPDVINAKVFSELTCHICDHRSLSFQNKLDNNVFSQPTNELAHVTGHSYQLNPHSQLACCLQQNNEAKVDGCGCRGGLRFPNDELRWDQSV